jgi:hypothetical protein
MNINNKNELLLEVLNAEIMKPFRDMGYYFGKFNNYLIFVENPISINSTHNMILFENIKNYDDSKNKAFKRKQIKYLYSLIANNVENNNYNWKFPNLNEERYITNLIEKSIQDILLSTMITTENYINYDLYLNSNSYELYPILRFYIE